MQKEKELAEKLKAQQSLEGGTPSNTPPPLTPAHNLLGQRSNKVSPLAVNDKKPEPSSTTEEASSSKAPQADDQIEETKTEAPATTVDKNGKVVKTSESNGKNVDISASASKSSTRSTSPTCTGRTKSKLCCLLWYKFWPSVTLVFKL